MVWVVGAGRADAQVSFKTEYFGRSAYMYAPKEGSDVRVGKSEGSSVVYQGAAYIPFYMKRNEGKCPTMWGVKFGGAYVSLDNEHFTREMVSEIVNLQLGVSHMRPLGKRWSMLANVRAGVYTPFAEFSRMRWNHVMGSGGVMLIWHLRRNLDVGGGLSVNNSLGYLKVFPSLYVNWRLNGKFKVNVTMGEEVELLGGYEFNDWFKLSLALEMNRQMALMKKEGERMMFSHHYTVVGVKPEVRLGKSGLSLFAMGGLNARRSAEYHDEYRSSILLALFAQDYYFRASPYVAVGVRLGF